jgi:type VI protein secretion system component Hcp
MPHQFLMTLSFKQQGKVTGSVPTKSHSGTSRSPILSVYTGPVLPWLGPKGKQIVVTKQIDSASPLLWSSSMTKEVIPTIKIEIYGSGDGKTLGPAIGQVGLTNAVVRSVQTLGHHVKLPPTSAGPVHQITFGFQTATLELGSSASDWAREWTRGD